MGNEVNWKALAWFLLIVGVAAAGAQWAIVGGSSVFRLWSLIGTVVTVFSGGLLVMDRWLWRLRIRSWRPFGWVTKMPDVSGKWSLEMTPSWKKGEPFSSRLTIRQTLFSLQLDWRRPAGHGESRAAALYSLGADRWHLACVYEYEGGPKPEEHTVQHQGCLNLQILDRSRMEGSYWTNKRTGVGALQMPGVEALDEEALAILSTYEIGLVATAGTVVITRDRRA
jgi:hypothetical protein